MTITISHQKGGVGKSTTSWNLAIELSKITKVEVIDLDVQQTVSLNNVVRKKLGMDSLNVRTFKDIDKFKDFISNDSDDKIILIDTGAYDSGLNRLAVLVADLVITPVSSSTVELQGLETYRLIIEELNKGSKEVVKPFVLLNSVDTRLKKLDSLKKHIKESGFDLFDTVVRRRIDFVTSLTNGKSVVEYDSSSNSSNEIGSLINEIKKILSI